MTDDADSEQLDAPLIDPLDDAAISALLAGLPEVSMPVDVSDRIAAALAAELPLSGPVPAWAASGATNVSVLPSARERQARTARRSRVLSSAAAVVLVFGAVVVGTQFFDGSGGGPADTAGGAAPTSEGGAKAQTATLLTNSGAAYSKADLSTQVTGLVQAASAPGAPLSAWVESEDNGTDPGVSPTPDPATGEVESLVRRAPRTTSPLATCVTKLVDGTTERPVAVDAGTWEATPVAVVVLPGETPKRVDVYVVTAGCGDPAVVDDSFLIYYAAVARP